MSEPAGTKGYFIAAGGGVPHHGLLANDAVNQWDTLQKYLSAQWKAGDQVHLSAVNGCLEKLSASLLQVNRIRDFHQQFLDTARANVGKGADHAALRGATACADFESLLLQGRAALDRLTWFVSREFKQSCSSFRKLESLLQNFEKKGGVAQAVIQVVRESTPWIGPLLGEIESGDSFRDFVAHKGAATEKMNSCFGITFLDSQRALLFDCELGPFPVFRTSVEAVQHLSFTVLNTLAACTGHATLPLHAYGCQWRPQTVVFSDFVIHEPDNAPLGENYVRVVRQMNPDGFVVTSRNVKPEVFALALALGAGSAAQAAK